MLTFGMRCLFLCIIIILLIGVIGHCELCHIYNKEKYYCPSNIGCLKQSPQIGCHCNDMSICRIKEDCYTWKYPYTYNEVQVKNPEDEDSRLTFSSCDPSDPKQQFTISNYHCTSKYSEISWKTNKEYGIAVENGILNEGIPVIFTKISDITYSKKWIYNRNNLTFSPLGDPSLCMTAYNSRNLTLTQCSGVSNQKWYVITDQVTTNSYRIVSISAGSCISTIKYEF